MQLPLVVRPETLPEALPEPVKPIDLRSAADYEAGHLPGAVRVEAKLLNRVAPPVGGLLPSLEKVNQLIRDAGLEANDHVLAYDAGASTEAARLIWVLHAFGFHACSWLDGGYSAWQRAGGTPETGNREIEPSAFQLALEGDNVLSAEQLLTRLDAPELALLDVRSLAEFRGEDVRATMGGHIPGARHLEWTDVFGADGRLKNESELRELFASAGLEPSNEVVVYCQTHQRSAVT